MLRHAWPDNRQTSPSSRPNGPTCTRRRARRRRWRIPIRGRPASTRGARWSWRCIGFTSTTRRCKLPYQDNLSALIHEPTFKTSRVGRRCSPRRGSSSDLGNQAVHSHKPVRQFDALTAVRELFHVAYWLARTYARGRQAGRRAGVRRRTRCRRLRRCRRRRMEQLQRLEAQLRERDEKLAGAAGRQDGARRGAEAAARRGRRGEEGERRAGPTRTTTPRPRPATTSSTCCSRKPAGRSTSRGTASSKSPACRTSRARASSTTCSGATTASRSRWSRPSARSATPRVGQQQAKLYADCLEKQFGRRPVIFYSNGYEHWLWDDANYPPRPVQGFYKKAELELLIQRRATRKPLADAEINEAIVERYYQTRAIRRIGEAFETRPRPQGAAGDGDRRGQDAHGDRAVRSADALQLGEARAVPRRPRGAGESGGERLQEAPARRRRR